MKHVVFRGGLGNQMFQYALILALRKRGYKVIGDISYYNFIKMHNGYELNKVFGINDKVKDGRGGHIHFLRLLDKIKPVHLYASDKFIYNESILNNPCKYISGYWQDEKYFADIKETVRECFTFQSIDERNANIAQNASNCESVALHLRRGDYASFGMSVIGEEYYSKAVTYVLSKIHNPVFYVFSDDKETVERLSRDLGINYLMISHNTGEESYKDMFLMSSCKHNIIANSSFSWWGAWLNTNNKKIVIAPKTWYELNSSIHPQLKDWVLI